MNAPTRKDAEQGIDRSEEDYGTKYPKTVTSLRRDQDEADNKEAATPLTQPATFTRVSP